MPLKKKKKKTEINNDQNDQQTNLKQSDNISKEGLIKTVNLYLQA